VNTYLVTLSSGATQVVAAENYNADARAGLQLFDQFGGVVASWQPGVWADIAIINPQAVNTPASTGYQSTVVDAITGNAAASEDGDATFTGGP
jgi:hypothetical protein